MSLSLPGLANAADPCQPIYNGGSNCSTQSALTLDKTVQNPQTGQFTAKLLSDIYVFARGQNVVFHLTLTNTTTNSISSIQINDQLPTNLDYISGDGKFNASNRTLTINVGTLQAKSSKTYALTARVNSQNLPSNQQVACLVNQASVQTTSFFFFSSLQNQNSAVFCLSSASPLVQITPTPTQTAPMPITVNPTTPQPNRVYPVPQGATTPPTGPEADAMLLLPTLFFLGKFILKRA